MARLAPYGSFRFAANVVKASKGKTPQALVARMPSVELAAKVGGCPTFSKGISGARRVVRMNGRIER